MGTILSYLNETYPPKSKYSATDVPDLTGKVMIVTGANSGVGKETARALLAHNAKVYIAARSPEKAASAIAELKAETGGHEGIFLPLDLSDLTSVKAAAEEVARNEKVVHVLFNNAGFITQDVSATSVQGYREPFATNVLGHFYFTKLLMPLLLAGAKTDESGKARIVNLTSTMSLFANDINYERLERYREPPNSELKTDEKQKEEEKKGSSKTRGKSSKPKDEKIAPVVLYKESKLANLVLSNELARRYGDQGIVSIAVNPGNLHSGMMRNSPKIDKIFASVMCNMFPIKYGGLSSLFAGTSSESLTMNGQYLIPWARIGKQNPAALDQKLGEELWEWLDAQTNGL